MACVEIWWPLIGQFTLTVLTFRVVEANDFRSNLTSNSTSTDGLLTRPPSCIHSKHFLTDGHDVSHACFRPRMCLLGVSTICHYI